MAKSSANTFISFAIYNFSKTKHFLSNLNYAQSVVLPIKI